MISQIHDEYESGKSCLPEPCLLLYLFRSFRRQPMSRMSLRRVSSLPNQRAEYAEALWLTGLPQHYHARLREHGGFRMVGTSFPDLPQSLMDQSWADRASAYFVVGRRRWDRAGVVGLASLLGLACRRWTRSGYCPGCRAGLFIVGEHLVLKNETKKVLTAAEDWDGSRCFRSLHVGAGSIPVHYAGGLGLNSSLRQVSPRVRVMVWRPGTAVCLGGMWGGQGRRVCRSLVLTTLTAVVLDRKVGQRTDHRKRNRFPAVRQGIERDDVEDFAVCLGEIRGGWSHGI
jgi:hypothetical protein